MLKYIFNNISVIMSEGKKHHGYDKRRCNVICAAAITQSRPQTVMVDHAKMKESGLTGVESRPMTIQEPEDMYVMEI